MHEYYHPSACISEEIKRKKPEIPKELKKWFHNRPDAWDFGKNSWWLKSYRVWNHVVPTSTYTTPHGRYAYLRFDQRGEKIHYKVYHNVNGLWRSMGNWTTKPEKIAAQMVAELFTRS